MSEDTRDRRPTADFADRPGRARAGGAAASDPSFGDVTPAPLPPIDGGRPQRTDTLARLLDADTPAPDLAPGTAALPDAPDDDPKRTTRFTAMDDTKSTARFEKALFQGAFDGELTNGGASPAAPAVPSLPTEAEVRSAQTSRTASTVPGYESQTSYTIGGRYLVEEGIAMGGMGAVFKVQHRGLHKHFALKIIHPQASSDYEQLRAFEQEVQVLSRMDHPSIVQVTDFGLDERFGVFLVMEYLHGESLYDRLARERRLSVRVALQIALQIAEALHHMHGQGLVHRDVKPENVFLCRVPRDGRHQIQAKLIDFGLARPQIANAEVADSERAGTPEFAAPEQFQGSGPRPSMDIYALGVLLFEMLTGKLAFDGTLEEVIARKLQSPPPSPNEHLEEPLEGSVVRLLTKAMAVDPGRRHQTMSELIFELRTVSEMLGFVTRKRQSGGISTAVRESVDRLAESRQSEQPGPTVLSTEATPLPVCVVDADLRIIEANALFGQLVCLPPNQLRGEPVEDTLLSTVFPELADELRETLDSQLPQQRTFDLDADGGADRAHVWLVPFDSARGPAIWLSLLKL